MREVRVVTKMLYIWLHVIHITYLRKIKKNIETLASPELYS